MRHNFWKGAIFSSYNPTVSDLINENNPDSTNQIIQSDLLTRLLGVSEFINEINIEKIQLYQLQSLKSCSLRIFSMLENIYSKSEFEKTKVSQSYF